MSRRRKNRNTPVQPVIPEERGVSLYSGLLKLISEANGNQVSEKAVLSLPAFLCGVRAISAAISLLSPKIYEDLPDGTRREARDHPDWDLFTRSPNGYTPAEEFFQTMAVHYLVRGEALAEIRSDYYGKLHTLSLLDATAFKKELDFDPLTGQESIKYTSKDGYTLWSRKVIHVKDLSLDAVCGLNPLRVLKEAFSTILSAEQYANAAFANDSTPGGIWELPMNWGLNEIENFKKANKEEHQGPRNAKKTRIAYAGAKFQKIENSPKDQQLLEARMFGIVQVAQILNITPHKLMDLSRATFSNVEELDLDFYQTTIAPIANKIAAEFNLKLLQKPYYLEHTLEGNLRARHTDRIALYQGLANLGVITPNQIAKKENLPSVGAEGDKPLVPLNKGQLAPPVAALPEPEAERAAAPSPELETVLRGVYLDDLRRLHGRESQAVIRAVKRDPVHFRDWAEEYYRSFPAVEEEYLGKSAKALTLAGFEVSSQDRYRSKQHLADLVAAVQTFPPGELERAVWKLTVSWKEEN